MSIRREDCDGSVIAGAHACWLLSPSQALVCFADQHTLVFGTLASNPRRGGWCCYRRVCWKYMQDV